MGLKNKKLIVLDTNILMSDYMMCGHFFRAFWFWIDSFGHWVYIPEVVVVEAVKNYRASLNRLLNSTKKAVKLLNAHLPKDSKACAPELKIDQLVSDYEKMLRAKFQILELPSLSHKQLLEFYAKGTAPYHHSESKKDGYRDTLVWLSVLELIKKSRVLIAGCLLKTLPISVLPKRTRFPTLTCLMRSEVPTATVQSSR